LKGSDPRMMGFISSTISALPESLEKTLIVFIGATWFALLCPGDGSFFLGGDVHKKDGVL
jgi:hypothetical protein